MSGRCSALPCSGGAPTTSTSASTILVAQLLTGVGLDDGDRSGRQLDALGRIAEQQRDGALQDDEHLFLRVLDVAGAAHARRQPPDVGGASPASPVRRGPRCRDAGRPALAPETRARRCGRSCNPSQSPFSTAWISSRVRSRAALISVSLSEKREVGTTTVIAAVAPTESRSAVPTAAMPIVYSSRS